MKAKWMTADSIEYEFLKRNARKNRNNMTEAESVFWQIIKGKALGERCLRQHVIGDYIVDFLFRRSKLIIEIDGEYHFTEEQQENDAIRQEWLESQGYKVLRFTNEQVLMDTGKTIDAIQNELNEQ